MAVIYPFDFERIFITILAGSPEIFTALFFIFISGLSAYFKFDSKVMFIMYVVAGIVMASYMPVVYMLIILIVGIITFYSISRMFNR
jgi:hypothetical protein